MKNDSTISIPLISFSSSRKGRESGSERGENIFDSPDYTRISPPGELPDKCYGVRVASSCQSPLLPPNSLAVFSRSDEMALGSIYAVGVQDEIPFLGKWMQKVPDDGSLRNRRKVFMVPTPLHIPDSQVSPIAESLHHVLLFKDLQYSGELRLIPAGKIIWKHPLIYVEHGQV